MLLATSVAWGVDYVPDYKIIDNPEYPTLDLAVATFNVLDYGIDPTGKTDCTTAVQNLLDAAAGVGTMTAVHNDSRNRGWYGNPTGGIVYFPEGIYLFSSSLHIPRGVTIRGDWKQPVPGKEIKGTIFKINPRRGAGVEIENNSFIIMQPTTEVNGIAFWYPMQKAGAITKFPPTILYGENGYWGNDYCTVQHCTFVNSYTAIQFYSQNGGGCPNIFDIYGTPLSKGVVMDCIADVGRFDGIHFSPAYWAGSGLENAPAEGEIDSWLYENATGFIMRRNDWSYTCNFEAEGYNIGFHTQPSPSTASAQGNPNGHNYNFRFSGCKTGIMVSGASNSGIMFTKISTPGCETGIEMPASVIGPIQVYGCDISGSKNAILITENGSPGLMLQDSKVSGNTEILNGQFSSINSTFSENVHIGPKARTIFVGNSFTGDGNLINESLFECKIDQSKINASSLPDFKQEWMERRVTRPARKALYVATNARFGAVPLSLFDDLTSAGDNTQAIQSALDAAGADGGGVVYLPTGHYRVNGTLTIPSGVELKGSGDLMTVPKANGTVLETYHGEGNEAATPFITMERGSGLRGITINYPNQTSPVAVKKYPYAVRGNADVYICNLAIRAAYRGVDLFTNKCDNHYVDYLAGHAFMNVIRVGGGSANGVISNIQCNTIAYACGDESKFGCWPNCNLMKDNDMSAKAYGQNSEDLDFMIIGDCTGEVLYNNFLFGCHQGMIFRNDGSGGPSQVHSLGNAVDGAVETFVFNGGADNINLINSQVVALNHDKSNEYINKGRMSASFVVTGKDFSREATFFSGNFWGGGDCLIKSAGGTVNLYSANLAQSGAEQTISTENGGKVNFINVYRRQGNKLFSRAGSFERYCSVEASILNCNNANQNLFSSWSNNLPLSWDFATTDNLLSRSGWKATAFNDVNGYSNARLAIDGNTSTRWSSEGTQASGQWFAVDFGKVLTINTAIFDTSASPNDGPQGYTIEVFDPSDGIWREVASGTKGASTLVVQFDECEASKLRINQTANAASGYWSIHEFYVADLEQSGIEKIQTDNNSPVNVVGNILFTDDRLLDGEASVAVYNLSGSLLSRAPIVTSAQVLENLPTGISIVVVMHPSFGTKAIKIRY